MGRNSNNKTKKTSRFNDRPKIVYKTVVYPKIDRHVTDIYIDVLQSDRLDNLAFKYYSNVRLWWILAEANKLGKGSLYIPTGRRIRIPHPDRVGDIVTDLSDSMNKRL